MRLLIYTVAVPLLTAMAFAQATPPAQTQPPAQPAAADKTTKDTTAAKDKMDGQTPGAIAELKTQSYSGTLTDASCASSGAASPDSKPCPVSATTAQFALILKDGTTVKFDDVGNMRTQEAFKTHKKWADAASASKPVRVKAGGILNGDKMTVTSIN